MLAQNQHQVEGNSLPIRMRHLGSAIHCLHKTSIRLKGTHDLFACGILDQQSIACTKPASGGILDQQSITCTKPQSGRGNSRPICMRHLGSAIHHLHKTTIRLRELTPYSHAASWISNPLLAQNHNQVEGTHALFACGILDQQSIACTKPQSG